MLVLIPTELEVELLRLSSEEGADPWHERCDHDDDNQREDEQGQGEPHARTPDTYALLLVSPITQDHLL